MKPTTTGKCIVCGGSLPSGHWKYCKPEHAEEYNRSRGVIATERRFLDAMTRKENALAAYLQRHV